MRTIAAVTPALLLMGASPAKDEAFRASLVASVPKLAMLARADPAAFDRIAGIYERGEKQGRPRDELIGEARAAFVTYQQDRMAHAPDALLLRSLDSTIAVADDLLARSPERCAALFTGGNAGDIGPFLSASTRASEDAVYVDILEAERVSDASVATQEIASAPTARVMAQTATRLGTTPTQMIRGWMANKDAAAMCRFQRDVLGETRRDPHAAAIMRARFTASGIAPR